MPIKADISVDKSSITDARMRLAANFPVVREKMARTGAEFIGKEAVRRAPYDVKMRPLPEGVDLRLRESMQVQKIGPAEYEISFERYAPWKGHDDFDVALWTHEGIYNASDPDPGVGRRYLARAYEENEDKVDGIVMSMLDEMLEDIFNDG